MTPSIYVSAVAPGTGKVVVSLGLVELGLRETSRVGFFRPVIVESPDSAPDEDIELIRKSFGLNQSYEASYAWSMSDLLLELGGRGIDGVMEKIVEDYKNLEASCDFIVIDHLAPGSEIHGPQDVKELREIPVRWRLLPEVAKGRFLVLKRIRD